MSVGEFFFARPEIFRSPNIPLAPKVDTTRLVFGIIREASKLDFLICLSEFNLSLLSQSTYAHRTGPTFP